MTREVKRGFSSLLLNIPLLFLPSWKKLEKCEQTGEIKLSRKGQTGHLCACVCIIPSQDSVVESHCPEAAGHSPSREL